MRQIFVSENDCGQRFDKYLFKYFSGAPSSFVYKMLRKKNIELNGKKSDGKDILKAGDVIKIFMLEETIEKFTSNKNNICDGDNLYLKMPEIVYEDRNILIVNKPVGMLSQKSSNDDTSFNEIALSYLAHKGEIDSESLMSFKPSICNRLDRNTGGILIFAKNYVTARVIAAALKDRSIHKYYRCIVTGKVDKPVVLNGELVKNNATNTVSISNVGSSSNKQEPAADGKIYTSIKPIAYNNKISYLDILLITGKTHQIRAHLASIGHGLLGDYKYGNSSVNDYYRKKFGIKSQMLWSVRLEMPDFEGEFAYLSQKVFEVSVPDVYRKVLEDGNLEIPRT